MQINVVFTTQLKAALGISDVAVELEPGATLPALVETLRRNYTPTFSELAFDQQGDLLPSLLICVNDQQRELSEGLTLADGDTVTLLSAISGG